MFKLFDTPFKPDQDIPSLAGKVLVITGANAGLGYQSLIHLAKHNGDVCIINVASVGHKCAPRPTGFIPEACATNMARYNTFTRYGQSKLANILFTNELARRYPAITSVSIHPGGIMTGLSTPF